MSENREPQHDRAEIVRNDALPHDPTVVVEEVDRTVVLTDKETIVIEKPPTIDIASKDRPHRVYLGMWGQSEIAVVALGALSLVATLLFFMFVVSPAKDELSRREAERNRLTQELANETGKYQNFTTTEDQVVKLIGSVNDFESRYLPVADFGRTSLYQRINTLIAGYGLVNTSGPDFAPLDPTAGNAQNESKTGRGKFQSRFPGVYVSMTVEGSYQNLRRFVRDLETGSPFSIISSVEFEPTENEEKQSTANAAPQVLNQGQTYAQPVAPGISQPTTTAPTPTKITAPAAPRGKTIGETVSLRIELAAYFRRSSTPSVVPQQQK